MDINELITPVEQAIQEIEYGLEELDYESLAHVYQLVCGEDKLYEHLLSFSNRESVLID